MTIRRRSGSLEMLFSLFIILATLFALTVWLLVPHIRTYSDLVSRLGKDVSKLNERQQVYDQMFEAHRQLADASGMYEEMFGNETDVAGIEAWGATTFDTFSLIRVTGVGRENDTLLTEYNATVTLKSPVELYDFVKELPSASWVVGMTLPIEISKTSTAELEAKFSMTVHRHE